MTNETNAALSALRKMAEFISTWEDCLSGVQMSEEDFIAQCGLSEYREAIALIEASQREPRCQICGAIIPPQGHLCGGRADYGGNGGTGGKMGPSNATQREAPVAEGFIPEQLCHLCGEQTSNYSANPGLWPIALEYEGGNGDWRVYHRNCVIARLAERPSVTNVSREVVGLLTEISMLDDDDAEWTSNDIKTFGNRAARVVDNIFAPAPGKAADEGIAAELDNLRMRVELCRCDDAEILETLDAVLEKLRSQK